MELIKELNSNGLHLNHLRFLFLMNINLIIGLFLSFQQLVVNECVLTVVPLTQILPYTIEFEEKLWDIPFNELS